MADITALTNVLSRVAGGLDNMIQQQAEQQAAFTGSSIGGVRDRESIQLKRNELRQRRLEIQRLQEGADAANDFHRSLSSAGNLSGIALREFANDAQKANDIMADTVTALTDKGIHSDDINKLRGFVEAASSGKQVSQELATEMETLLKANEEAIRVQVQKTATEKSDEARRTQAFLNLNDKIKATVLQFASLSAGIATIGQGIARSRQELETQFARNVPGMMLLSDTVDETGKAMGMVAWQTGMSAEAFQEMVAANRMSVRAIGGSAAMMESLAANKNGIFELFGDMDVGGAAMGEFTTMLLRSGVAIEDLAGAMGGTIQDMEALSQQTGMSGKELLDFYQTINSSAGEQLELLAMGEEDRKKRVKSYADMASWGTSLNMTAQQTAQVLEDMRPDPNADLRTRMGKAARMQQAARFSGMSAEDSQRLGYLTRQRTLNKDEKIERAELLAQLSKTVAVLSEGEAGGDKDVKLEGFARIAGEENMADIAKTTSLALKMEQERQSTELAVWNKIAKATEKSRGWLAEIYRWWTKEFANVLKDPGLSITGGGLMGLLGIVKDFALLGVSLVAIKASVGSLGVALGFAKLGFVRLLGSLILIPTAILAITEMLYGRDGLLSGGTGANFASRYIEENWNGLYELIGQGMYEMAEMANDPWAKIKKNWKENSEEFGALASRFGSWIGEIFDDSILALYGMLPESIQTGMEAFSYVVRNIGDLMWDAVHEQVSPFSDKVFGFFDWFFDSWYRIIKNSDFAKMLGLFQGGEGANLGAIPTFLGNSAKRENLNLSAEMIAAQQEFKDADAAEKVELFDAAKQRHQELAELIGSTSNENTNQTVHMLRMVEKQLANMVEINERQLQTEEDLLKQSKDQPNGQPLTPASQR